MKRLAALLLFVFVSTTLLPGQTGLEWINYSQSYIKIPVAQDALYRVTADQLETAGFPAENADVEKLQLFHRGIEQRIIVSDGGDGQFNGNDYLEFYGWKNDGSLDKELYSNPDYQPHRYHNLFSDTTAYFLTIGSGTGKRAWTYRDATIGLTSETFHHGESLLLQTNEYSSGKDYGQIHLTTFDQGEGWMSTQMLYNQPSKLFTLSGVSGQVTSGEKPKLEMVFTGRGPKENPIIITIGPSSRTLAEFSVTGYETKKFEFEIEWSDITAGELPLRIKVTGEGTRASVNYLKLIYPKTFNMNNAETFVMHLRQNAIGKSQVQITNYPSGTRLFDITDPTDLTEILGTNGATLQAIVRNTNTARKLVATTQVLTPVLQRVNFRNINATEHNYIIISHPELGKAAGGYGNPVKAYAAYRGSAVGGNYDTLLVNIGMLYNQFNYGEQSPLAIHHFMKYLSQTRVPDYLLIIGKGLDVWYDYYRNPGNFTQYKNLVPTAGYPASDIAFTAGINGSLYGPGVATGRITAMTSAEVAAYLNKVKETETRPFNDLRRKNILHLSGGVYAGEPQAFRSYLQEFEPIAEGFYLGGKVSAVAKQSTDLKLINIADEVNKGLSLITFFGHSSPGILDFDIGRVTDDVMGYRNKGKYPVLLMNGCDAGAFFLTAKLFGEDWINAQDRGAIGFIAHSSLGFVGQLRKYSEVFYEVGYADSVFISKGIGDIQKEAIRRYAGNTAVAPVDITHLQNMVLLGDPAVPLFGAPLPDYAIEDANLSVTAFEDERVTTTTDSFAINFIVRNYGQAVDKPLKVEVTRTLSDRSIVLYDSIYPAVRYSDTLQFIIRGGNLNYAGDNDFAVNVDHADEIDELNEENNDAYINFFLPQNSTLNLYPAKFAIVNQRSFNLAFQHTDLMSEERQYLVEIDTSHLFVSDFKQSFEVTAKVLALQPVTLADQDTTVYFWRTKLKDPVGNESRDWTTSSFTYIMDGPEGWAQSNFYQLNENEFSGLVADPELRRIQFEETKTSVEIKTFGATIAAPSAMVSVKINNAEYNLQGQGYGCRTNALNLIAFNKNSTVPYAGIPLQWFNRASRACGREPFVINNYVASEMVVGNNEDLIQYVNNIPAGDSVVLFSMGDAGYALWPEEAKTKLGELGIAIEDLDALEDGEPVVIYARKGSDPGSAVFFKSSAADPRNDSLQVTNSVTGRFNSGEIASSLVGPATSWQNLIVKIAEHESQDQVYVDIIGVNALGQETLLFDNIAQGLDISGIDASSFPFLKLVFKSQDVLNLTSTQLRRWLVTFEPVREGLLFYSGSRETQSFIEGQPWTATFDFINVTNKPFESPVPVTLKVFNHEAHESFVHDLEIDPPAGGDTTTFTVSVSTLGLSGLNDVEVFVNPKVIPEHYYHNNLITLFDQINVTDEHFNPVLDVMVDNRHIRAQEFVSGSPVVDVMVWDENRYLPIIDTTGLEIFLAYPCEEEPCTFTRINFSQANVSFRPNDDSTAFLVTVNLADLADGTYVLRVQADDQSGNLAGIVPYEISFNVKSEATIELSDAYPNPVSEAIHFDLILSGSDIPYLNLDVFSLNGSFVYELREADFDLLHQGFNTVSLNLSNATVPAGIYIYRLRVINTSGVWVEKRGKLAVTR